MPAMNITCVNVFHHPLVKQRIKTKSTVVLLHIPYIRCVGREKYSGFSTFLYFYFLYQ